MYYILFLIMLCLILVLLLAGNYFYNFSILRRKKEFMSKDPALKEKDPNASWDSKKDWLQNRSKEELTLDSLDGIKLSALYLPCSSPSDKTVILVHGYNSWNGSMGGFAHYYAETLHYNVLLPDLRGHGKSEGKYIGFGWHDRKDILKWIDYLSSKAGGAVDIVLHGVSMGAAAVLMTSGEQLPANVKCIVSDCAYNSIKGILSYQMKRMFKLPKQPLMLFTSLICKLRAGYFFKEASAVNQVRKCKVPILFIHGSADRFVPTEMVYELYEAAACEKELLVVQEAGHGTSFWKDATAYKAKLKEFLDKHIAK